jgi:DNA-binding transcriptional ArsR family regulator
MKAGTRRVVPPDAAVPVFAALGDKTRFRLVWRLCEQGPMSITGLSAGAEISRQAITKHLRVMEDAGLVSSARRGRESVWQLDRQRIEQARRYLEIISRQWDDALGRLRRFVEE